jgi:hypothetical protein
MGDALAQAVNARLKLRFFNQTLGVAVDQSGQALTELAYLRFQSASLLLLFLPTGLKAPSIFRRQPIGMCQ